MRSKHWLRVAVISAVGFTLLASTDTSAGSGRSFPALIQLPADFGPEGIEVGEGSRFYVGSLGGPTNTTRGQILVGDLRTGRFRELVAPDGIPTTGIKHDARSNLLFVARAGSGMGTVYNARSGNVVRSYQFQVAPTFINDAVITREAVYFTDTQAPFLYRVALGRHAQPSAEFTRVQLPGDFRTNGIVATRNGKHLLVVNAADARLYRIDVEADYAVTPVDLGSDTLPNADGLLLGGRRLFVVQNRLNRVAVVRLSPDLSSGEIVRFITEPFASNPNVQVPTTIARFGNSLYAVTAGFAPPTPDFVVRLRR